jgi:hypothetical protein
MAALMRFDLRDEHGNPIPLLSSRKNREVDAAVLIALAPDGDFKNRTSELLANIARGSLENAHTALQALDGQLQAAAGGMAQSEADAWARTLVLATDLVANSLLWARVRSHRHQRQVVKFGFDAQAPRELLLGRQALAALKWVPIRVLFPIPHLGDGGSYHFELEPPAGLRILGAAFEVSDPWEQPEVRAEPKVRMRIRKAISRAFWGKVHDVFPPVRQSGQLAPFEREPNDATPYVWNARDRAYLYVSGRRKHYGVAKLDMAVENTGFVNGSLVFAGAISLLLTVFFCRRHSVTDNVGAAVTILLLVPALLGYLVVRPGEHPLVHWGRAGVRLFVLMAGALPVTAALALVAGADTRIWWRDLAIAGWLLTVLLFLSWFFPGPDEPASDGET